MHILANTIHGMAEVRPSECEILKSTNNLAMLVTSF